MYFLKWAYLGQLMLVRLFFFQVKKVVFFSRIGTTSVLSATHRRNGQQTITNIGSDGARARRSPASASSRNERCQKKKLHAGKKKKFPRAIY
jgi:hypothetical protein